MHKRLSDPSTNVALLLIILAVVVSLRAADRHTLIIKGESKEVPVIFVSGHPYVGLLLMQPIFTLVIRERD